MKKLIFYFYCALLVILGYACKEYDFDNPVDPTFIVNPPSNLALNSIDKTKISLSWSDNSDKETYYEVFCSIDGADYSKIKTFNSNTTYVEFTLNYIFGKELAFKVRAVSPKGNTDFSNIVRGMYGEKIEMVDIEGGNFMMGNNDGNSDVKPLHNVILSNYKLAKYEVTQSLWKAVMGNNPSGFMGNDKPVEKVNFSDVMSFLTELKNLTGINYRLPTEAEWEYAAKGGKYKKTYLYSGGSTLGLVGWYESNSSSTTHSVGLKTPNSLGIYDMSGNVWEWCNDWYSSSYYSISPSTNPQGPSTSNYGKVRRGGCFINTEDGCTVTFRYYSDVNERANGLGFRIAL